MSSRLLRAEDHLDRRGLLGGVERHEPLRDHALARLQVVPCDAQLTLVLAQVALDLRAAGPSTRRTASEPARAESERSRSCPITCCASARFDATTKGRQTQGLPPPRRCRSPRERTAPPQPTYDKPLDGAGTGAPGGAGTSRRQEASRLSGRRQPGTCRNRVKTHAILRVSWNFPSPEPWYGPRLVLGQAQTPRRRFFAVRRHRPGRPRGARRSAWPGRRSLPRRCAPENAQLEARSRSAVLRAVLARPAPRRGPGRASSRSTSRRPRCAPSARVSRMQLADRAPRRPPRAARGSRPGSACSTSRATSSRSRSSSARRTSTRRSRASTT